MTKNNLRFLYLLSERNEVIEKTLKNIKDQFEIMKNEINYEKNIAKLMGKNKNVEKCKELFEEFKNDVDVLNNLKIKEEFKVKPIDLENHKLKNIYFFEELNFNNINIEIMRIRDKYYKVKNIDEVIATTIKTLEETNYFMTHINENRKGTIILKDNNFKPGDFVFRNKEETFYINKDLNNNEKIKTLLKIIDRKMKYRYDDFALINIIKPKRKKNGLTLKEKAWTGKKPISFIFKNQEIEVDSWIDLFTKVLSLLRKDIYSSKIYTKENIGDTIKNFMFLKPDSLYRPKKIKLNDYVNVYIRGNYSAQSIRKKIIFLLDYFNYNQKDFYVNLTN
jgi:hypothetical protein